MNKTDLKMVRGDTFEFQMNFTGLESALTAVNFTCKKHAKDSTVVFQKTLNNGVTANGDGKYTVRVAPADTANTEAGWYEYDLECSVGSDVYTILLGRMEIIQDVTN